MASSIVVPSPLETPSNLTQLSKNYKIKATLAIFAILSFFVLYVLLIIGLGYLVYWAFTYDMVTFNKLTILAKIGAIAGTVMMFAFTLKFIFNLKNHKSENRIKLHKEEYPELFEFVYQICKETGAPNPKSIYVDPDVNAYVSYTNVWLSLFFPTGKDLTIGLGLVSALNISEFKAVTAHEFGHFAQKSMKIGSYIHSANTIIFDMIYNRDKWDNLLDKWRSSDIRLSFAAWLITPLIWVIRKALELFYMFLNFMHSALSREMEFNADKVAVKATGSEAIVSALWKLDFGSTYWNTIVNNAYHATKKNVFAQNLYLHNLNFIEKDKHNLEQKRAELPKEDSGSKQFFSTSNSSKASMYASHPPNDHREKNAKTPFVICDIDTRSPWLLFSNATQLQQQMTSLIYENYIGKKPKEFVAEVDFEKFIESETRNIVLTAEYENTFDLRFITIPELSEFDKLEPFVGDFALTKSDLLNELKELMIPVKLLEEKMNTVQQIAAGESKEKRFEHNGTSYSKKQVQDIYTILFNEREAIFTENFKSWDKSFLENHYRFAKKQGQDKECLNYYMQQKCITAIYQKLISTKNTIYSKIDHLQNIKEVSQLMINNLAAEIINMTSELNESIATLETITFMALSNIDSVDEMKEAIIEGGKIPLESGMIFEDGGVGRILNAIENAIVSCNRVENKNIDQLLLFYKSL